MGTCGSKSSPLLEDGPPSLRQDRMIKPIEMVPTGSTFDDLAESNILEPDDIEDMFPITEEKLNNNNNYKPQQPLQPQVLGSQQGLGNGSTTTTLPRRPLPNHNSPAKIKISTLAEESPLPVDKNATVKILNNVSPPSSSMKLEVGLAKLEVPVQSPRNTKKVSAQEFFNDDLKSMDFDLFDSPLSQTHSAVSVGTSSIIQEIALNDTTDDGAPTNKLQRSRASIQTTSTSSYEEVIIEDDDDDFEVESTVFEVASNGSYVEEVIDDQVFEAFVKAQQESVGRLTFDEFIHQQQHEEEVTENTTTCPPAAVEPSPPLAILESGSAIDQEPKVEMLSITTDLSPVKVTNDDHSAIATEITLQTDLETTKQLSETTSMQPMSFLISPQTPLANKIKPNGPFVGMELHVAQLLQESTNNADRFLVSPLASPSQYTSKSAIVKVPFSPLSPKGMGENPKRKSPTGRSKRPKTEGKKKTKSHSPEDDDHDDKNNNNTNLKGEKDKKSHRKISRPSTSGNDKDKSKEHRKHHRRKEESSKSLSTKSNNESKGRDSSRCLDKEKKEKPTSSSKKKADDGTTSKRSSTSTKKISRDKKYIVGNEQGSEDVAKKESASPRKSLNAETNPIVFTKPQDRRSSRKIKFQPRTSKQEEETKPVDHQSLESDRSDFVKKMDALRARMEEVVGGSARDLPSMTIPASRESNERDEKPRGTHKIRRKKSQEEKENIKDKSPDDAGIKKVKHKHSSNRKGTTSNGQGTKTSSSRLTNRDKS